MYNECNIFIIIKTLTSPPVKIYTFISQKIDRGSKCPPCPPHNYATGVTIIHGYYFIKYLPKVAY
jgi:hypothetical protein